MRRASRLALSITATLMLSLVFTQMFPDLADRLQVIAQQTYYYRQSLPLIGTDGAP